MIDKMIDSKSQSFSTKIIEKQDFPTKMIDTTHTELHSQARHTEVAPRV